MRLRWTGDILHSSFSFLGCTVLCLSVIIAQSLMSYFSSVFIFRTVDLASGGTLLS